MASSKTLLQTIVEGGKRAVVMSFYTMAFMGMVILGNLLGGSLLNKIETPNTVMIGGVARILSSLIFAKKLLSLRKIVRPIYAEKGILLEELQ